MSEASSSKSEAKPLIRAKTSMVNENYRTIMGAEDDNDSEHVIRNYDRFLELTEGGAPSQLSVKLLHPFNS